MKLDAALLCVLVLSAIGDASFRTVQAQINWREADSVKLGNTLARVEVSSTRQLRITAVNNAGAEFHSPDMNPVVLKAWELTRRR